MAFVSSRGPNFQEFSHFENHASVVFLSGRERAGRGVFSTGLFLLSCAVLGAVLRRSLPFCASSAYSGRAVRGSGPVVATMHEAGLAAAPDGRHWLPRRVPTRAGLLRLAEDVDTEAWPQPSRTVAELQAEAEAAKEEAEAAAAANPKPFVMESGDFSFVALATAVVFVIAGSFFFQGITGGGIARFAGEQSPEVQECLQKASTREEASRCLPSVPLVGESLDFSRATRSTQLPGSRE